MPMNDVIDTINRVINRPNTPVELINQIKGFSESQLVEYARIAKAVGL
ncbi:MAG: hypothetical protein NC548_38960 [Lachnospiraceae bacterium]|nr:hypothetical protein [Lachnospiraceae bacterium]